MSKKKKKKSGKYAENKLGKVGNKKTETILAILTTNTYIEAAEKLGITDDGLRKRREKYGVDEYIDSLPEEALKQLKIGSVRAAGELNKQLESSDVKDRNKAANDILGYVMPKQNNNVAVQVNFNSGKYVKER